MYILLLVYAAVNKLLDFENFQAQLGQSPLLSAFAVEVSYLLPITEIIIAVFLCFDRYRRLALYAAFSLMVMFTAYIIIILNFSPFVPCSCGGILEKFTWEQHLIFNAIFVVIAMVGIVILPRNVKSVQKTKLLFSSMVVAALFSASILVGLFLLSEDMIHHRNNFTRRFPNHPAELVRDLELDNSSYYLAGAGNGKLYIGEINNPLFVRSVDSTLKTSSVYRIHVDDPNRPYKTLRLTVKLPYFYLSDGTEAFVYRGLVRDWKAKIWVDKAAYFNAFVPIDATCFAIRALSGENNQNVLGVITKNDSLNINLKANLLDKQIDGVFDTDGRLLYNSFHRKLIYLYTYRNEYVVTSGSLSGKDIGHTIDTTSRANIKVAYVKSIESTKLSSPARTVNKNAVTDGDYLFVNSNLIGQLEPKDMWDEASIIDVYNFMEHSYLFSFYLYHKQGKKVSGFIADGDRIYTIAGKVLTAYHLDPIAFERNR